MTKHKLCGIVISRKNKDPKTGDRLHKSGAGNGREMQYSFSGETEAWAHGRRISETSQFSREDVNGRETVQSNLPTRIKHTAGSIR